MSFAVFPLVAELLVPLLLAVALPVAIFVALLPAAFPSCGTPGPQADKTAIAAAMDMIETATDEYIDPLPFFMNKAVSYTHLDVYKRQVVRQPTHHDSHGVTTPHQWDETQHIGYLG